MSSSAPLLVGMLDSAAVSGIGMSANYFSSVSCWWTQCWYWSYR